jgi:hypothetical protein
MSKLDLLVENYLDSSYRTTPVRSPFSQINYYSGGRVSGGGASWKEYTDLYNTTYRTIYEEDGFERVMYNEPLNMMVMWPLEEAEAFSHIDEDCVVQLGLKTARGFAKDYRFLDQSIPGAGKIALSEADAEELIEDPFNAIREVRPQYSTNLGEVPVERIDESKETGERLDIRRKVLGVIQDELDGELDRNLDLRLDEEESKTARKAIRYRQINESDLTRLEDALLDSCARQLQTEGQVSKQEYKELAKAIKQIQ